MGRLTLEGNGGWSWPYRVGWDRILLDFNRPFCSLRKFP